MAILSITNPQKQSPCAHPVGGGGGNATWNSSPGCFPGTQVGSAKKKASFSTFTLPPHGSVENDPIGKETSLWGNPNHQLPWLWEEEYLHILHAKNVCLQNILLIQWTFWIYTCNCIYIYICSKYVHTYINSIYIYIYIFNIHQTCINSRYKCMRVNLTMYVYVYKIILCQMYVCVHIHIQKI